MKVTKAKLKPKTESGGGAVPWEEVPRWMAGIGNAFVVGEETIHGFKKCSFKINLCRAKNRSETILEDYLHTVVVFDNRASTEEAIRSLRRIIAKLENGQKLRPRDYSDDDCFFP